MDLARVVGKVVCTAKNESLRGTKLLLVQPVNTRQRPIGRSLVAVDAVGAGPGELVFYVTGREASFAFLPDHVPADASIVGIVERVDLRTPEVPDSGRPSPTGARISSGPGSGASGD